MRAQRSAFVSIGFLVACGGSTSPAAVARAVPEPVPTRATPASPAVGTPVARAANPDPKRAVPAQWSLEALALPGVTGPVSLDYLFFEPKESRVWIPAGGTGKVVVFDTRSHAFSQIDGFKTGEREAHGSKRLIGPSAGAVGVGVAYIGNRATHEVCVVDLQTLRRGSCLKLAEGTDGVEYVAATREVWVTTPKAQEIVILDASNAASLKLNSIVKLPGNPEGYAVDDSHGLFFTNLEDRGSTLAIDLRTHAIEETWNTGCSSEGPRGLAVDSARRLLFVACTDHVQVLDMNHGGSLLGKIETGEGVDNIDYNPTTELLYVAAGKAAKLSVIRVADDGGLSVVATGVTAAGARNAVASEAGTAYVADPQNGRLLVLSAAH